MHHILYRSSFRVLAITIHWLYCRWSVSCGIDSYKWPRLLMNHARSGVVGLDWLSVVSILLHKSSGCTQKQSTVALQVFFRWTLEGRLKYSTGFDVDKDIWFEVVPRAWMGPTTTYFFHFLFYNVTTPDNFRSMYYGVTILNHRKPGSLVPRNVVLVLCCFTVVFKVLGNLYAHLVIYDVVSTS